MAPAAPATSPSASCRPDHRQASHGEVLPASSPTPASRPPTTRGNSFRDSIGFHTDGRVRNPVPTKLQGMTDNKDGNFAVMHIDLSGTKPCDRNAAAKRTSEETEAQARRAGQVGWQPIKRTKSAWHNHGLDSQRARTSSPATPACRTAPQAKSPTATAAATSTTSPASDLPRTRLPSPHETKTVQARLLTLLRTLHPLLVVDQLCKALAYFGGIPGAPPPSDGAFPSSAATNSSGSLLVSWLAEIFPPVDDPAAMGQSLHLPPLSSVAGQTAGDHPEANSAAAPLNGPVKRARGRPKGSKSSKVRKDKGMKKPRPPPPANDPSRVLEASQPLLVGEQDGPSDATHTAAITMAAHVETPAGSQTKPSMSTMSSIGAKKRGRPKGSKNKPKDKTDTPKGSSDRAEAIPAEPATQAPSLTSPTLRLSNVTPGAPSVPEDDQNGQASARSLSASAPRNDASLPDPAADKGLLPARSSNPPVYTGFFLGHKPPKGQDDQQTPDNTTKPTQKRPAQYDDPAAPADGAASSSYAATQSLVSLPRDQLTKRRRVSKDVSQQPGMGSGSRTQSPDVTASPALGHDFSNASPQPSASRSFDSYATTDNRSLDANMVASLGLQQQQHPQQFFAQRSQRPSPGLSTTDQRSHGVVQKTGPPRPSSQAAGAYGSRRHTHLSPQMIYAQQLQPPMSNSTSSLGHQSASLGRSMSTDHRQYSQSTGRRTKGGNGALGSAQQRMLGAAKGHQSRGRPGQTSDFHGQQNSQQAASQPHTMSSFHSINEQSYLNMDYGLTERDVQDAAAVTALGSPSQLETTPAQPKMRDHHIFQSIGRR